MTHVRTTFSDHTPGASRHGRSETAAPGSIEANPGLRDEQPDEPLPGAAPLSKLKGLFACAVCSRSLVAAHPDGGAWCPDHGWQYAPDLPPDVA